MGLLNNIDPSAIVGIFAKLFPQTDITREVQNGLAQIKDAKADGASEQEVIKRLLLNNKVTKTQIDKVAGFIESFDMKRLPVGLRTIIGNSALSTRNIAKVIRSYGDGNTNKGAEAPKLELPKTNQKRQFTRI